MNLEWDSHSLTRELYAIGNNYMYWIFQEDNTSSLEVTELGTSIGYKSYDSLDEAMTAAQNIEDSGSTEGELREE